MAKKKSEAPEAVSEETFHAAAGVESPLADALTFSSPQGDVVVVSRETELQARIDAALTHIDRIAKIPLFAYENETAKAHLADVRAKLEAPVVVPE